MSLAAAGRPAGTARRAATERPAGPAAAGSRRERVAVVATTTVRIAALWSVVALLLRRFDWVHWVNDAFGVANLPVAPSLFTVVLLVVLAGALRRRLRVALLVLLVFQALGVTVGILTTLLIHGPRPTAKAVGGGETGRMLLEAGLIAGVLLGALLWWARPAFPARLVPASRVRALLTLIAGLLISAGLSIVATEAFPDTLLPGRQRLAWAVRVVVGLPPDRDDLGWDGRHGHHWVGALVGVVSATALVAALLVFLRAGRTQRLLTADEELRLRRLLVAHGGRDSLGYFATRRDKAVIFGPGDDAAITYRVIGSVGLASADPVGPPAAWDRVITAWLAEMRTYGWSPAVVSASEEGARAYVRAGLKALPLGDEAVVDVATFTLNGPTMQPVRRAVTRVRKAAYTVRVVRHGDLGPDVLAEIAAKAEQWRGAEDERGFSMALGRVGDPADRRCVAVLARDRDGVLRGVQSYVPWGTRGLSLDLMRRDPAAENGTTEYLIAELLAACPDLGITQVSLNFAAFRAVFSAAERVGAGPLVRLGDAGLTLASRFWQVKSLYLSNERYLPRWRPRFLCYDPSLQLTSVAAAAGIAEGFVPGFNGRLGRLLQPASAPPRPDAALFGAEVAAVEDDAQRRAEPVPVRSEQERVRRDKLRLLREAGMAPYPVAVPRTCDVQLLRDRHAGLAPDRSTGEEVSVCGRVRALRDFGGLVIAVLQDGDSRVQVLADTAHLGPDRHRLWRQVVDLGDHVSVTGEVVTSRTGELSVQARDWTMAAKCLRPLPDPRRGFTDPDTRARHRAADLIVNADSRQLLAHRSTAVRALRDGFVRRGFTEVETPMLHTVHGGANARPFTTHMNAYDLDLYLRIAPELFLKRLCVGGMGRIFELNRNFRNEGADSTHNPEFTSVEAYQAYADYTVMRHLTRELILEVATTVHGAPVARRRDAAGQPVEVDLSAPWPTITVHDAISAATGTRLTTASSTADLHTVCRAASIEVPPDATGAELVTELYETLVEKTTQFPTFYTDFPLETSPLTRPHRSDAVLAERWDLVAFGTELGTAYSELVDPLDQRRRLTEQSLKAAAGDPDAMQLDEDFLSTLEYGMPPTGGLGLGVDRIVMMLTGAPIRATLAFPLLRPGR